ncbi:MAG TPA: thiamine pyrophosphate-requiring protein [Polyangia bacterium]
MAQTVGSYLLHRIVEWGIGRIYGYPGDGINGIVVSLPELEGKLRFVQVRHEEMAAFMACAHAKFTGDVGVCLATSGPGAIHLLNGLYDAKMDHQPVVAIVGQASRAAMGGAYQQEVDLISLFKDVAHEYVHEIDTPQAARHVIDMAIRIAKAERTVTCVIVPKDIQEEKYEEPSHKHNTVHSAPGWSSPRVIPHERELRRAAEVLNAGERVAMLVGAGALRAASEVTDIAEILGAGVAKALLGKATLPDTLPWVTGAIGLLGTRPSWELMMGCDTLLMVGSSFPYSEFLPEDGQARAVQIDLDGRMLGIRYPMEVNLCGDSAETLRALRPLLKPKSDRRWRQKIEQDVVEWWKLIEARSREPANPINPQLVFWELSSRLPDRCILTSDSGSAANWFARNLKVREGMMASLSGNLATMGPGVPYAIAAKFAFPDRPVIALVGDGAMQMNGLAELLTISKYWREWSNPQLIVLVLNNRDLNQVTWELRAMAGDPMLPQTQTIPDFDYAGYADKLGLTGLRVSKPEAVAAAWDAALKANRPCVVEAIVDPDVPPLPPHITFEEARAFASSLLKGDPHERGVIRQAFRDLFPKKK